MTRLLFAFFIFIVTFTSCRKDIVKITKEYTIVHLSHTRTDSIDEIDSDVANAKFTDVDVLCLGGDLMFNSSADTTNLNLLDHLFNLSSPATLWAIGNHDISNLNLLQTYTKKELYHAYYFKGITFIVLNTQASASSIEGNQLAFYNSVVDTMESSAHCVLIHHKLIWMADNPDLAPIANSISNGPLGNCDYCIAPNNFYTDIYPKLVDLQNNGIEVTLIGGDIGNKVNEFHYETADQISFYASGIKSSSTEKKVLYITYNQANPKLNFSYKSLNSLH